MNHQATRLGVFGAGLLGGFLVMSLGLGIASAANTHRPDGLGREAIAPAAHSSGRLAGPPPLALRVSLGSEQFLPLIQR